MKHVVLCADDFAITQSVSRGILELAAAGRISATSVMTNAPAWRDVASDLRQVDGRIGCGLHLNLSAGKPLAPMPGFAPDGRLPDLGATLRASLTRRLPLAEIESEIGRQLEAFAQHFGRMPDFVDGHQHVHVLPGIRAALLRQLGAAGLAGQVWLRDPSDRVGAILTRRLAVPKALLLAWLATGFSRAARGAGFAINRGFSGFSAFGPQDDLGADFARHFSALGASPVVMCHPGHLGADNAGLDAVVASRPREWAYLASDEFARLLDRQGIVLSAAPSP